MLNSAPHLIIWARHTQYHKQFRYFFWDSLFFRRILSIKSISWYLGNSNKSVNNIDNEANKRNKIKKNKQQHRLRGRKGTRWRKQEEKHPSNWWINSDTRTQRKIPNSVVLQTKISYSNRIANNFPYFLRFLFIGDFYVLFCVV